MPIRIRKTFTLFPGVKVNISKGGTSITVGKRGFHLNFSKRGARETVGLPGSGISETNYILKNKEEKKEAQREANHIEVEHRRHTRRSTQERTSSPWGFFLFVVIALFLIYVGASALGLLPPNLLANFLQTLAHWAGRARL